MSHPTTRALFVALLTQVLAAQGPEPQAGIVGMRQAILDASTAGVVLNVAAHPDDEASRTNIVLRRKYGMRVVTAYTTFGDGGQNAVGKEIGPELARLRVRETLRAASMCDVEVRWLGMQDFGFSKTLEETLAKWDGDKLKAAMRKVVDEVDPDFVITNHNLTQGHGHHRATFWAITEVLKERAAAGKRVPALYSRCPWDKAQWTVDPGELDPVRGETYARTAHRAWTQHITQGPWGAHSPLQVGKDHWLVTFPEGVSKEVAAEPWKSWVKEMPTSPGSSRLVAAQSLADAAQAAKELLRARPVTAELSHQRAVVAVQRAFLAGAGVSVETWLDKDEVAIGGKGKAYVVVHGVEKVTDLQIHCGDVAAEIYKAPVRGTPFDAMPAPPSGTTPPAVSPANEAPATGEAGKPATPPTPPEPPGPTNRFQLAFPVGQSGDATPPVGPEPAQVEFEVTFKLDGVPIRLHPRHWYTPVPPVGLQWDRDVVMVCKGQQQERIVSATVTRFRDSDLNEGIKLGMGVGVKAEAIPGRVALTKEHPEARVLVRMNLDGNEIDKAGELRLEIGGATAVLHLVPVEVFVPPGLRVALVRGPDDTLERALADLGVACTALDRDALAVARLEDFGTLLLDMRSYQHRPELAEHKDRILQFCRAGGRVVAMYHKSGEWNERAGHPGLAPFPLVVGDDRITEEDTEVKLLQPEHRLFTNPHRIGARDFAGWVQERGLSFPSKWDPAWVPLLEMKDSSDKKALQSALLYTQYGRGDFVYCSLVLYRQLRAGNAGAARILVNLLTR